MRIQIVSRLLAALPITMLAAVLASAQQQPPPRPLPLPQPAPQKPADDEDAEVLARGVLHEAFATSGELPVASPIIDKRPPDPVEELPPDQKPEGDNVLWISGYWDWDEEDKEFTWISGFWRNAPAGRVWVPGDWREVNGGWQWVPGFWNVAVVKQEQQADLEYLPPPPELIEAGPSVVAPSDDCFYTPGCWVYRVNRYVWRPGFWVVHRPDWVWVPDHYRWTPSGYLFVHGYWDAPLATRGVLFAPVRFRAAVLNRPRFVYTPAYVVPDTSLHTCLFVRSGRASYFFGDYFEQRYVGLGYSSWSGTAIRGTNFAVGVTVTRTTYDPLWSYYSLAYRDTPQWQTNLTVVYGGRFRGDVPRPPRTLVQQNKIVNVTNVTNNNTTVVVNNPPPAQAVLAPLSQFSQTASQPVVMTQVNNEERVREQKQAKESRQFTTERRKVETALVDKGLAVTKGEKPRQAKLEVPKAVVARVQQPPTAPEKAPPPPATAAKKPDPKAEPAPKPVAKRPPPPVIDPKTGAVAPPKKVDPPKPTDPVKPTDPPAPKPGEPVKPPVKPVDPPKPTDPPKPPVKPPVPVDPPKPPVKPTDPPKTPVNPPKPIDPPNPPVKPSVPVDPPKPTAPKPTDPPAPKPVDPPKPPAPKPVDPPKPPAPKPVDPPKPPATPPTPPKVDPPKPPVSPPKPVNPPKPVDPPKPPAPAPVVIPPKPVPPPKPPVTSPPIPKPVAPPKPPATPPKPPKVDPPKPKPPATPPTKPKEEKPKDKGGKK